MASIVNANYEEGKVKDTCPDCGGIYFSCVHAEDQKLCRGCDDTLSFRCMCYKCLFDGTEPYEDQWDTLKEVLTGIGMGMLKKGEQDTELYPLKSKDSDVVVLYEFYKYGFLAKNPKLSPKEKLKRLLEEKGVENYEDFFYDDTTYEDCVVVIFETPIATIKKSVKKAMEELGGDWDLEGCVFQFDKLEKL